MSIVVRLCALYIAWLVAAAAAEDVDAHAMQTCPFAYLPQHQPPGPVAVPIHAPHEPDFHVEDDKVTRQEQMPPPSPIPRFITSRDSDWWQFYQASHSGMQVFRNSALFAAQNPEAA
jgi:hypothetical protein